MGIGSSLGMFFGGVTEPFTQKKESRRLFELTSAQLDSLADSIRFQQSLGGISTSKPFKDIEMVRSEARKRLTGNSALPSLMSNALVSVFTGQGLSLGTLLGGKK